MFSSVRVSYSLHQIVYLRFHFNVKVSHTTKYFAKCSFFSSQIYHKAIFYTAYFYANLMLLNLNTVRTLTEMKLNLLQCIFFVKIFSPGSRPLLDCVRFWTIFFICLFQIHPNSILSTEISKDTF